jgi:hypothetical protein
MQWQFGDWDSLVSMDWATIKRHPRRAELALLTSAALQQLGNSDEARERVLEALKWGCDRRLALEILLAGVHNTLGRVAAIRREDVRALQHFQKAVAGVSGDLWLACQARSVREIVRLGLMGDALRTLLASSSPDGRLGSPSSTIRKSIAVDALPPCSPVRGVPHTIVVAGMRHSGSTALFNLIRLALQEKGLNYASFYSEGVNKELLDDPDSGPLLIKAHEVRDDVLLRADVIITTRRDLRDTVASAKRRKFPLLQQLGGVVEYAKYNRVLHDVWLPHSDYQFVYESYMASPEKEVRKLLSFLGLDVDVGPLCAQVANLPDDDYATTLLSNTHITDPYRMMTFEDTLDPAQIIRINTDHAGWLQRYGYPLQHSLP